MGTNNSIRLIFLFTILAFAASSETHAQEKLTVSYSSVDAPSANWYIAQEKGLYKKSGLDVESIFIPASSTNVAVLVAGQLKLGNGTGGTIAANLLRKRLGDDVTITVVDQDDDHIYQPGLLFVPTVS